MMRLKILIKKIFRVYYKLYEDYRYDPIIPLLGKGRTEKKLCIMMHQNDMTTQKKFMLPARWNSLFDSEAGSDVVFLVGTEPEIWRFPGHRSVLHNNPVFKAMLEGPLANSKIAIQDVDGRAFDYLLRYLYQEDVHFQSVNTALTTLYAANKYLCPGLVEICVKYLDEHIDTTSVLQIYQHLRFYSTDITHDNECDLLGFPSAPLQSEIEEEEPQKKNKSYKTMLEYCNSLLYNCYNYIDTHADEVLNEENIEDLTKDALYDIAKRDTLGISSESVLFSVLEKWCNRECKRCQLELSIDNRKLILGDGLLFSTRYLLMNSKEFLSGPMKSGLFDQIEIAILLGHILKHPVNEFSSRITPQILDFLKKVRCKDVCDPIPLSARTEKRVTNELKPIVASKLSVKKEKKKKNKKNDEEESKCFNCTVSVLSLIFD